MFQINKHEKYGNFKLITKVKFSEQFLNRLESGYSMPYNKENRNLWALGNSASTSSAEATLQL